jgi:heptosyltransferase-3
MDEKKTVLVFRTGHLGDTVCAIPAFRLIRNFFPTAQLSLLCDRPSRSERVPATEVTRSLGIFDTIESYRSSGGLSGAWQILRIVRKVRPSMVIALSQVRETVESVRRKRRFFQRCGVPDVRVVQISTSHHDWQPNEADRLIRLLDTIGIIGEKPNYSIPVDSAARIALERKLKAAGIEMNLPFLVFCGGGKASTQCWPLDRYAIVLKNIATEMGIQIVGIGTPEESERYRVEMLPVFRQLQLLRESLTVSEMFELFRLAYGYLGNDSGPMHVAAALDCPVAVVMSSRNSPGSWDPDTRRRLVIRHRTECEDCFLQDCVVERHRCMTAISVERVINETLPFFLSRGTRRQEQSGKS